MLKLSSKNANFTKVVVVGDNTSGLTPSYYGWSSTAVAPLSATSTTLDNRLPLFIPNPNSYVSDYFTISSRCGCGL